MFNKLPVAFISGIRVNYLSEDKAIVHLPFKFITKNPFQSIYFASQAMAAELSTGILALLHTYEQKPVVSMLVFNMKADFTRKAKSNIIFECTEGLKIKNAIDESINSGEGVVVQVKSTGKNKFGEVVSEFYFSWTFKPKH
jgi:hypothetical protein